MVGANDCLLKLSETLGEFELLEFGKRTRRCSGGPNVGGGLEEFKFSEVYE